MKTQMRVRTEPMASDIALAESVGMERSGSATPLTGFGCDDEISLGGDFHSPEAGSAHLGGGGWGIFLVVYFCLLVCRNVSLLGSNDACNGIGPGVTG